MGFFDFLSRGNGDGRTRVYFEHGQVVKIIPTPPGSYYENRDLINAADCIVSEGVEYDLTDKKSIYSIKVPQYIHGNRNKVSQELGATGYLEYVLRMHSGKLWNEREFDLSMVCLEKATELMKYSTMGWPPKDFFRIVNELNDLGRLKKARQWKKWIERNIPGAIAAQIPVSVSIDRREPLSSEERRELKKECDYLETDLVEVGSSGVCCEVCAKYRNRIYTLTGKATRFPKLPKDFHKSCGLSVHPYILDISSPTFPCDDPIRYSNRPFIDDRTEQEIENYEKRMEELGKQPEAVRTPSLSRIIYYQLVQRLPDLAPKSYSGFSRMRNANSKNYQEIVRKAAEAGFIFPTSIEEVEAWEL